MKEIGINKYFEKGVHIGYTLYSINGSNEGMFLISLDESSNPENVIVGVNKLLQLSPAKQANPKE